MEATPRAVGGRKSGVVGRGVGGADPFAAFAAFAVAMVFAGGEEAGAAEGFREEEDEEEACGDVGDPEALGFGVADFGSKEVDERRHDEEEGEEGCGPCGPLEGAGSEACAPEDPDAWEHSEAEDDGGDAEGGEDEVQGGSEQAHG